MRAVFAEAAARAAEEGWGPLTRLSLRELRDWPGALVRAHWRALRKETTMTEHAKSTIPPSNDGAASQIPYSPAPWREAALAGLPHVIAALIYHGAFVALAYGAVTGGGAIRLIVAAPAILAFITAAAIGIAWQRGWPRWSASWFAYLFLVVAMHLRWGLEQWQLPLGSWRAMLLLPQLYMGLLMPVALAGGILLLGLRHRFRFLLAILPLVLLLWRPALESVPVRSLIEVASWLSAAGVAVLIARVGSVRKGAWMTLGLSLVVGLTYTYLQTYHARFPSGAPAHYHAPGTLLGWWSQFALGLLVSGVLILVPLAAGTLRELGRRGGSEGRLGFGVSLTGVFLLLATDIVASWWYGRASGIIGLAWNREVARSIWVVAPASVAVLLCAAGAALLRRGLARRDVPIEEQAALAASFVLILLPAVAALPLVGGFWDPRAVPTVWAYVLGVPWSALGLWLISQRPDESISNAVAQGRPGKT
jgi:hypothetical protein